MVNLKSKNNSPVMSYKAFAPATRLLARSYFDTRLKKKISQLKLIQPTLKIGETHCHSNNSDGISSVKEILHRAANIGLDFVIITDHVAFAQYSLERALASIRDQWECINEWNLKGKKPMEVYPAFEVSTLQGHLILILDKQFMKPENEKELLSQFSHLDRGFLTMEQTSKLVHSFGGVSIIAHPDIRRDYPFGANISFVKKYLQGLVHGIEDISTGHGYSEDFSNYLDMASIGSTDDHFNLLTGATVTGFDETKFPDFISAVKAKRTRAIKVEKSLDKLVGVGRLFLDYLASVKSGPLEVKYKEILSIKLALKRLAR